MDGVKEPVGEFAWVVLLKPLELFCGFTHSGLESLGWVRVALGIPEFVQNFSKPGYDFSFISEEVGWINLIFELSSHKVLSERSHVTQTLDWWVHIACIAEVLKAHDTVGCSRYFLTSKHGCDVNLILIWAVVLMVPFIHVHVILRAVGCLAAWAVYGYRALFVVILTFSQSRGYFVINEVEIAFLAIRGNFLELGERGSSTGVPLTSKFKALIWLVMRNPRLSFVSSLSVVHDRTHFEFCYPFGVYFSNWLCWRFLSNFRPDVFTNIFYLKLHIGLYFLMVDEGRTFRRSLQQNPWVRLA